MKIKNIVSCEVTPSGTIFKTLHNDGYRVFEVTSNSYNNLIYDVWSNRVHNVNEVTPVAARTARRHFKAMVEDKPLNALA